MGNQKIKVEPADQFEGWETVKGIAQEDKDKILQMDEEHRNAAMTAAQAASKLSTVIYESVKAEDDLRDIRENLQREMKEIMAKYGVTDVISEDAAYDAENNVIRWKKKPGVEEKKETPESDTVNSETKDS